MSNFQPTVPTVKPLPNQVPSIDITSDKLPSRGVSYPKDFTLGYSPYTFGETKLASGSKMSLKETFDFVLSGINTSIDKMDLTLSDVMYLGMLRKISTLDTPEVVVKYMCPKCGKQISAVTKLSDIEFDDIQASAVPVIAKLSFGNMLSKPLTVGNYFELMSKGKEKDEIAMYAIQVTNMSYDDAYHMIHGITNKRDSMIISRVDKYLYHGVKPILKECGCGYNVSIELDGGQALILPFRKHEESIEDAIHFGMES